MLHSSGNEAHQFLIGDALLLLDQEDADLAAIKQAQQNVAADTQLLCGGDLGQE